MHRDHCIPLLLVLSLGCTPKSIGLGDTDDFGGSDESAGADDPTTSEPGSAGLEILDGVGGIDLAVGADGSIVVIGQSDFASDPYVNYHLVSEGFQSNWIGKFDAAGASLWVNETPLVYPNGAYPTAVAIGPGGGIFVAWSDSLHKLAPSGQTLWTRPLPMSHTSLAITADGRAVVVSETFTGHTRVPLVRIFDPDGALLVEQAYDRPEYHELGAADSVAVAVAVDDGDGAMVLSGGLGQHRELMQGWLMRADLATGALLWHEPITEDMDYVEVGDIGITADGTILAAVASDVTEDAEVRAYSRAGELLWSFVPTVSPRSLAVAPDGSFALANTHYLDPDGIHPLERCTPTECPAGTLVERRAADRSLLWSDSDDACNEGLVAAVTPSNGIVVLGQCSKPPYGPFSIGLLQYAQ